MNIQRRFVTTNMRFPEDLYMSLKTEALNKRMSFTSLVHQKLTKKTKNKQSTKTILNSFKKLAQGNRKYFSGKSLSDAVTAMRYEQ
ncbi:MAG: hypothetical protein V1487_01015 [bacterium]